MNISVSTTKSRVSQLLDEFCENCRRFLAMIYTAFIENSRNDFLRIENFGMNSTPVHMLITALIEENPHAKVACSQQNVSGSCTYSEDFF